MHPEIDPEFVTHVLQRELPHLPPPDDLDELAWQLTWLERAAQELHAQPLQAEEPLPYPTAEDVP